MPGSTKPFTYFIVKGWTVPDYYTIIVPNCSLFILQFVFSVVNLILGIEIQSMDGCVGHK